MSTLDSTSTMAQIEAALADNGSFFEDASVAKARAFVTASIIWMGKSPRVASSGGRGAESVEWDLERVLALQEKAERYATANATVAAGGAGVRHVDLRDFRV